MTGRFSVGARGFVAAVLAFGLSPQSKAEQMVLRLTLQLPITNPIGQNVVAFKERVESRSDGDIRVEIYPSAQLYRDKEVPQAVASGAVDMGVASLTRFAGTRPTVDLFYLPFLFDGIDNIAEVTAPGHPIRDTLDAQILSTGARPLWWQPFGPAIMLGKDDVLDHPNRIKGRKVRVFGKTLGEFVRAAGGAPVLLSGSEQFLAYQRGTVDFGMTGVTVVKSRKLYDVMNTLTKTNHAAIEFVVLINEGVWQRIGVGARNILSNAAVESERELRRSYAALHEETLEWLDDKMTVRELSSEGSRPGGGSPRLCTISTSSDPVTSGACCLRKPARSISP